MVEPVDTIAALQKLAATLNLLVATGAESTEQHPGRRGLVTVMWSAADGTKAMQCTDTTREDGDHDRTGRDGRSK
ncbi:hypothetical protein SALBM135S_08109 [Streptomyces alboniger]